MKTILVHGPAACGKTRNAFALAKHYGLKRIIDGWRLGDPLPKTDCLVLTNEVHGNDTDLRGIEVIPFEKAVAQMKDEASAKCGAV